MPNASSRPGAATCLGWCCSCRICAPPSSVEGGGAPFVSSDVSTWWPPRSHAFVRTTDGLHVYLMKTIRYTINGVSRCGDSGVLQERQYGAEVYVCDAGGWLMRALTIEIND